MCINHVRKWKEKNAISTLRKVESTGIEEGGVRAWGHRVGGPEGGGRHIDQPSQELQEQGGGRRKVRFPNNIARASMSQQGMQKERE